MSLISRSPISARQRAANRSNARQSTGPRTPEGKGNSRVNGLKHGLCAGPLRRVMSELGEDPEEFDRFQAGLREATEPANALEAQLVEDLAVLWWKKRRSERAQAGVQAREVERLKVARQRELHDVERLGVEQSAEETEEVGLLRARNSRGKFQIVLEKLDWLMARLERHQGWEGWTSPLEDLYGQKPTVRGVMIWNLSDRLRWAPPAPGKGPGAGDSSGQGGQASGKAPGAAGGEKSGPSHGADAGQQAVEASPPGSPPLPACWMRAELLNLLLEERQEVVEEYRLFRREHEEVSEAARDACLAPTDLRWTWILRQDNYLDRQLERKIRLLDMLQEKRRKRDAAPEAAPTPAPAPSYTKMQNRSHQTVENTGRLPGAERAERIRRSPAEAGSGQRGGIVGPGREASVVAEAARGPGG